MFYFYNFLPIVDPIVVSQGSFGIYPLIIHACNVTSSIQVNDPAKYGFSPKDLLSMLTDIYLHLAGDALAKAVASDARSYRKELFDDCVRLLHKNSIKTNVSPCGIY